MSNAVLQYWIVKHWVYCIPNHSSSLWHFWTQDKLNLDISAANNDNLAITASSAWLLVLGFYNTNRQQNWNLTTVSCRNVSLTQFKAFTNSTHKMHKNCLKSLNRLLQTCETVWLLHSKILEKWKVLTFY
jgi:hypothetical protein